MFMERAWVDILFLIFCWWLGRMGRMVVWYIVEGSSGEILGA